MAHGLAILAGLLTIADTHAAVAAETRKNVIFVVVDDLNTELGRYGNRLLKSPNINRIASRETEKNAAGMGDKSDPLITCRES